MATRVLLPREQVFSNIGIVGSGYRLFFYETGTTTKKDTYSNEALTIANTNPVVADSAGRFSNIWISDSSLYKCVLAPAGADDPATNPIWTADPVNLNENSIIMIDPLPTAYWGFTTGTSTSYVLDIPNLLVPITSYSNKQSFFIDFHIACGVAPVININSLGAINLKKYDNSTGTKVALQMGDINRRHLLINDGVDIIVLDPNINQSLQANNLTVNTTVNGSIFSNKRVVISNNVSDANNDIDCSAGASFDVINYAGWASTAKIKRLDVNWAAGTNQGGLDTGSKANNTFYYWYSIYNPTSNADDFIATATFGSPTLPSGYTRSCYVGAVITDASGNILPFKQVNDRFYILKTIISFGTAPFPTAPTLLAVMVPPSTVAMLNFAQVGTLSIGSGDYFLLCDPTFADLNASATNFSFTSVLSVGEACGGCIEVTTNSSSQISIDGAGNAECIIMTRGWIDPNL